MNADYIIIGGGVYGCSIAWELASAGAEVVLLERGSLASGSSGGLGARGVRANGRPLPELPLVRRAQELWPTLDERLGGDTGYQRIGGLKLIEKEAVGTRGGRVSMEAYAWVQNQAGIPTKILQRPDVLELEPDISDKVTHAIYCPEDGVAEQERTTLQLATAAQRAGALLVEDSEVRSITRKGARVTSVETSERSYRPRKGVIMTANTGTTTLLGSSGASIPSWFVVPQVAFIQPPHGHSISHLVGHDSRSLSLKAGPNGSIQVSGGWRGRWNAEQGRGEVDPAELAAAVAHAAEVYPNLAGSEIICSDAARPEGVSQDGLPVIDRVPGSDNLYIATNWSASGFALFPAVAEAMREWLLEGKKPGILSPFNADRFTAIRKTNPAAHKLPEPSSR